MRPNDWLSTNQHVSTNERAALLARINDQAVVRQHVRLSSGQTAEYYVDLRRISLDGTAAPMLGRQLLELAADLDFDAVGGPALAAVPVAMTVLHAAAAAGRSIDAFAVRNEGKKHGLQRRIEGPQIAGRRVLAVEDTSTTGASVLTAVEAMREAGAEVVSVAVVVDRDTGAREALADAGLEYRFLYRFDELVLP